MKKVKKHNIGTSNKSITDFLFVAPLKKDNTNVNNQNFIENIEYPNEDIRTWNELSQEEQQALIDATPEPVINVYKGFDVKKALAAKRYNNAKGYATFETRTGEQILKDRDDYRSYQVRKYFDEQNANEKKCGGKVKVKRNKAFWGALIGAGIGAMTNLIGGSIQAKHQEHIAEMQYNQQKQLLERQDIQNEYNQKLQNQISEQENDEIYDELRRKNYKCGGKIIKRKKAEFGLDDMGRIASSLLTGLNDKGLNYKGLNNIGLNNIGTIGSSLITGLSSIGINAMNANTQSKLADYQMKLMEDKFNSESKKFYSYTGQQAVKSLREYIYGDKDKDLIDNKNKNLFQNKRMYLS